MFVFQVYMYAALIIIISTILNFTLRCVCSTQSSALYFIIAHDNNITEQAAKLLKFEIHYISN